MVLFAGPPILVLMTLSLCSAEETDYLEVIYPQKTITASRTSSAKLSCEANYEFYKCGVVHVVWHKISEKLESVSTALTDPNRYLTTVNETIIGSKNRRRQVVTEIRSVSRADQGRYQCKASCDAGEQAMGHFITIAVEKAPFY